MGEEKVVREARWRKAWSYQVLGVPKSATLDEINIVFARAFAKANRENDEPRRAELMAAREALMDVRERARIDILALNMPLDMETVQGMRSFCYPNLPPDDIEVLLPDIARLELLVTKPNLSEAGLKGEQHSDLHYTLDRVRKW
ncbi:MAG: hypothetical protein QXQ02_09785, partial [Halobacteria archaeon]